MKKLFTTSLYIILSFTFCKAQWVTIPDTAFVSFLQVNFPACMNGNQMNTTCPDILNDTELYLYNTNIADLTGLIYFQNLKSFSSYQNYNLTQIPALPSTLTYFNSNRDFRIKSLPALPESLTYLNCTVDSLTGLPDLPPNLNYLDIYADLVTSLPALPNSLTYIDCESNAITFMPALPYSLKTLECGVNQLTSLPTLPDSLQELDVFGNPMPALPKLDAALRILSCPSIRATSLPALPDSLQELDCYWNYQLTSLPALPSSLIELDCFEDQLTSLPALPKSLQSLDCGSNLLTELPPLPDSLQTFDVGGNPGLLCMPPLKKLINNGNFSIANTGISCLPSAIQHTGYIAAIDTMPICGIFNKNGCQVFWNISGDVFKDDNSNCFKDAGEQALHDVKVNLYQSGNLVQSGYFSGNYSFKTDIATYTVKADTADLPFNITCPLSGDTSVNVASADTLITNVNFGVKCKPGFDNGVWDIHRAVGWHLAFFPGDTSKVYASAGDVTKGMFGASCSNGISGQVQITINGPAGFNAPLAGALTPTVNGNVLSYTIPDFSLVNSSTDFGFSVTTNSSAQIGDQICFDVSVTPTAGDNNLSNNHLEHCFSVSASYDPNEKEVSPIGNLPFGFSDWLTYTIHFQNTGTAAAQNIQVLDTLDTGLDPETFQLLSYSFDPIVQIKGNDVAFDFVNINLPDSTVSKTNSTGYVEYRIKPFNNLAGGTSINNRASIYFDFNSPIVTNTTTNTIELATGIKTITPIAVNLYPNPASGQLIVSSKQLSGAVINVNDVLGRTIFVQTALANQTTLDVSHLTPGVYFLHIRSAGVDEVRKFVKE